MPQTCTIVIADPDTEHRSHLAELVAEASDLTGCKVAVHEIDDGKELLRQHEELTPHLIICEALLPGVSGFEALRRLHPNKDAGFTEEPAFFIVTHMNSESDRYWGLRNGASAYVMKPYEDELLRGRVRRFLESFHQNPAATASPA